MMNNEEYKRLLAEQNKEAETIEKAFLIKAKNQDRIASKKAEQLKSYDTGRVYEGIENTVEDKPSSNISETTIRELEELEAVADVVDG
jgi:hypothetical protein